MSELGPLLRARDLSFGYARDQNVLRSLTCTVARGELVGLVGRNGAGKTTLLRSLAGIAEPKRGEVLLEGTNVRALPRLKIAQRIAYMPQRFPVEFDFTAKEIVAMGRFPHRGGFGDGARGDDEIVERALELARAGNLRNRLFPELSAGEAQRVLFARILAQESKLLLLDEPTANLDSNHTRSFMGTLRRIVDDGGTVVAAMHDIRLVAHYCDRVLVLSDGQVRSF